MNTKALKIVRGLFTVEDVPVHVQRHNQRQWVKSVRYLGDKWLLAKTMDLHRTNNIRGTTDGR